MHLLSIFADIKKNPRSRRIQSLDGVFQFNCENFQIRQFFGLLQQLNQTLRTNRKIMKKYTTS